MDPFYESLLFSGIIAFLLVFLLTLIRDLDNPFGYYERFSGADVTLKPFEDTVRRLGRMAGKDCASPEESEAA
jgi:predicted membrane chloride channel (bestrophin family)